MTEQLAIFDQAQGQNAKREGMTLAAEHRRDLLQRVRSRLIEIANDRPSHTATADDAQQVLVSWGYTSPDLGNAAGSLFRGWIFTGTWVESKRVTSHSRMIRVWRLR